MGITYNASVKIFKVSVKFFRRFFMKFKKLLSLAAVGVMTASVLAGCGNSGGGKSGGDQVQLDVFQFIDSKYYDSCLNVDLFHVP